MEYDLIPQLVIIFSAGIIILIFAKNFPKIEDVQNDDLFFDEKNDVEKEKEKFLYLYRRIIGRINKEKYRKKLDSFWIWLEKFVRKIRINLLKLDNKFVSPLLGKLREKNVESSETITYPDSGKNKAEEIKKVAIEEGLKKKEKAEFSWDEVGETKREKVVLKKSEFAENKQETQVIAKETVVVESGLEAFKAKNIIEKIREEAIDDMDKGEKAGKEKEYIAMIMKNPADIKAYWKLGIIYSRRKNYQDAIDCFRYITKIDPTFIKARKKVVDLLNRMKKKKANNERADEKDSSDSIEEKNNS